MKFSVLKTALVTAACVAACGVATSAGAAAFTNGSFELGVDPGGSFVTLGNGSTGITGWVVGGDSVDYIGGYWNAEDGSRSVDLSGNANGSVAQTFDTVAGQTYVVNFFLAGNPDGGPAAKLAITSADGAQQQSNVFTVVPGVNTRSNMGWADYTYQFTAATTSTTLAFASATNTAFGPALDNVSIATVAGLGVPEPASWALMLLGFGGLGAVLRRQRRAVAATA
jgi:choice-of-anchor C domain-containing protein